MHIGEIDGHEVVYDPDLDTLHCKGFTLPASRLVKSYESTYDKEVMETAENGEVTMRKGDGVVILGCFKITPENSKQLIKKIKNARKRSTTTDRLKSAA